MLEDLATIQPWLPAAAGLAILLTVALAADLVVKQVLLRVLTALVRRNEFRWDDEFLRHNVHGRVAQIIPVAIIINGIGRVPDLGEFFPALVGNVAFAWLVLVLTLAVSALLKTGLAIYESRPSAEERPLKGFFQLLQIVVFIIGGLLIVATLLDKSPALLLSGFGAMTAVLLIVFKDTLLGLVASVQLATQGLVRVGDWIEMPQYGADGDVEEVGLHTVQVRNFDRTITTIPTYKLISESFRNWRPMSESGGRRIKRALRMDQTSVRFLSPEEAAEMRRFSLLEPYLDAKLEELERHRAQLGTTLGEAGGDEINQRRLTNIGTFRAYVFHYLKAHPKINEDATLLVRQLPPGSDGLPIEIYCFTRTTEWGKYEDIQSDIFDHIIAIVPEFGLRLFQQPSGRDFRDLLDREAVT